MSNPFPSFEQLIAQQRQVAPAAPPQTLYAFQAVDPGVLQQVQYETDVVAQGLAQGVAPELTTRLPGDRLHKLGLWVILEDSIEGAKESTCLAASGTFYYRQRYWPTVAHAPRTRKEMWEQDGHRFVPLSLIEVLLARKQNAQEGVQARTTRVRTGLARLAATYGIGF